MAFQYIENPLLFINSSDASIPKGRNARTQSRTQQASLLGPAKQQNGSFGELNLNVKRHNDLEDNKPMRKRRMVVSSSSKRGSRKLHERGNEASRARPINTLPLLNATSTNAPLDPSEVLTVATFHIRRIAAMVVRSHPDRLGEVLRCRQWSCVSSAFHRFGRSRCVDSALFCVAAKLHQITGGTTSSLAVLSSYAEALQELQRALQEPKQHEHADLLTTTQLLAVYEMLDSLDNTTWTQHVAGATSLVRQPLILSYESNENALTFAQAAPMFTDALLSGNNEIFQLYPWHFFLGSVLDQNSVLPANCRELLSCLLELPELQEDARLANGGAKILGTTSRQALLDRAHVLKARLRTGLLLSDLYSRNDYVESFDMLGLCLAGLVALDRVIEFLRPVQPRAQDSSEDKTSELCAQLLQLELGAADAYPASDLMAAFQMSTFQQQAGFVIVLPGPTSD